MTCMNAHTPLIVLLAGLALVGVAAAQDAQHIDTISASNPGEGQPMDAKWTLDRDDLDRLYPAVARAIASPNFLIEVADDEQESTRAYFDEMTRRGADVVEVDGAVYTVGISIASGGLPPAPADETAPDAQSHSGPAPDATSHADAASGSVDSGILAGVGALAGLALIVGLAAMVLTLRRA